MWEHLSESAMQHRTDFKPVALPEISFREYMKMLGYFDDMKKLYK